jgi:thimet oligopeptidase
VTSSLRITAAVLTAGLLLRAPTSALASPPATASPAGPGVKWDLSAAEVTATCDAALATAQTTIKQIESTPIGRADFANGIKAVETAVAQLSDALVAQSTLSYVAIDKDVRDASTACNNKTSEFGVAVGADPIVYAMAQLGVATATDAADRKLAQLYLESGRREGAGLDPATRAQTTKMFDQINEIQMAFGRTLSDDATSIVISAPEAAPLPIAFVKALKPADGGYRLPVNESTYVQFMSTEPSASARQRFFIAYFNRGGQANVTRLEQIVALRDQLAHELGFDSWAAYKLDAKMAKTPERVIAFLTQIDSKLLPKARAELATLKALKAASGDATPWQAWDYYYYEHQLIKTKYAVDDEAVRQFFPVTKVIPAVMGIYEKLLGVTFREVVPADAWAPDVSEYLISDTATGQPIAWFYLDLYPRPGKYSHFATFPLRAGRVLPDGTYQMPISSVIGNWPVGAPGKPALLSHDDVVTFFHEFGHLMHSTLSTARYETYYGTAVREDFVEAPSQMLENWMWQPSILKQVSSNVATGEPLPDDLIQRMVKLKHVASENGAYWTGQAFFASYDMTINSSGPIVDVDRVYVDLKKKMTTMPAEPGTTPVASFEHLVDGYDAGYYGYLWSLVYAQDMFTVFEKGGLENPAVGARYRTYILAPGGSVEPDQLLRDFLGREPSNDAFYKELNATR